MVVLFGHLGMKCISAHHRFCVSRKASREDTQLGNNQHSCANLHVKKLVMLSSARFQNRRKQNCTRSPNHVAQGLAMSHHGVQKKKREANPRVLVVSVQTQTMGREMDQRNRLLVTPTVTADPVHTVHLAWPCLEIVMFQCFVFLNRKQERQEKQEPLETQRHKEVRRHRESQTFGQNSKAQSPRRTDTESNLGVFVVLSMKVWNMALVSRWTLFR